MKAQDAKCYFRYDEPISDESLIECPECNLITPLSEWAESCVPCDVCGDHPSCVCPECCEHFDHVWAPTFKVK